MLKIIVVLLSVLGVLANDGLTVTTDLGVLVGHLNEVNIREWKGIPYAKPPVGDLRWSAPETPAPFTSPYQANFNAAGCPQVCNLPPGNCPAYGQSEDCLYLTVMSPGEPSSDPEGYPVLFWIHGGAFEQGLGNCALYNSSYFALKGVVSVVINYRLGALGFMASTSMEGNYGLHDQRLAMQWTQRNIAAFGGNPKRVTIAGQSAGAMSVGAHMIASGSKGLFSAGIMESNPLGLPFHTRESADENADALFAYLGCTDLACMKSKSVDEILDAQKHAIKLNFDTLLINFLPFAPMVDGDIPRQPFEALGAGEYTPVPLLSGTMTDEGQLFVYELFTKPVNEIAYNGIIEAVFGIKAARQILKYYPFEIYPGNDDGRNTLNVLSTDLLFHCPLRNISRGAEANQGKIPTFLYRFKHVMSFDAWGENYTFCVGIVCHGSELPFVFNVFNDGDTVYYDPTPDEVTLTENMLSAWSNFILNGDPNDGYKIPVAYPAYNSNSDPLIVLEQPGSYQDSKVRDAYCNLWDSLGYFY